MAGSSGPNSLIALLVGPANVLALAGGVVVYLLTGDWLPLAVAGGASAAGLGLVAAAPRIRQGLQGAFSTGAGEGAELPARLEGSVAHLSPSQQEHFRSLKGLRDAIVERYRALPGGRVLAPSSAQRLDALLSSFVRLVSTLNAHRELLASTQRGALEAELAALKAEVATEVSERLKEVKARRVELLERRVDRYRQALESREVISHQLASIEDALWLTHEQSIAIRDPLVVSQQLDELTAEVAATEETVKEMEAFIQVTEVFSSTGSLAPEGNKVR